MRKIFHLHLPKTGGMALQAFLVEQLGAAQVSPALGGIKLTDALLQWQDIQAITGHFAAKQGDILPRDRLCMTVLRDPIERFVSEFSYNKHDVDDLLLDAKRFTHNLDEYCESLARAPVETSSVQLGMLYPLGTDVQTRLTTEEKLSAARGALDQFELVGVTEELDDFAVMLTAVMDWPYKPLSLVNATSKRMAVENLSTAQRAMIQRLIEPEAELYHHALSRFRRDRRGWIGRGHAVVVPGSNSGEGDEVTFANVAEFAEPRNFGDLRCEILSASVSGSVSGYQQVMAGEVMNVTIEFAANQPVEQLNVGIAIKDERGMLMYGSNTLLHGSQYRLNLGRYAATFTMVNRLGPGRYQLDAALMPGESHYDGCYHWQEQVAGFVVDAYAVQHYEGRVLMDAEVWFDGTSPGAAWQRESVQPPGIAIRSFGRLNGPLQDFTAIIEPMVPVDIMPSAVDGLLQVRLTNNGSETWPSSGRNPIHLSYRWRLPESRASKSRIPGGSSSQRVWRVFGLAFAHQALVRLMRRIAQDRREDAEVFRGHQSSEMVVADGLRTVLREDMSPGASQISALQVRTPKEAGLYLLEISLVQEQVAWFSDRDENSACFLIIEVR